MTHLEAAKTPQYEQVDRSWHEADVKRPTHSDMIQLPEKN
jgi:hypothetical protein